ncbi:MAG: sugar phosphate isomerase/epimerase [Clostridia bacterium]|nr:sugar phosphate isomerase/epimerase [Clostridia bacterium]
MAEQFIISGFSDEIDESIDIQFKHLNSLGIEYFEPRGVDGKNISELSQQEVEKLAGKMNEYGIKVSSIGSPVGKILITDDFCEHFELFKKVVATAKAIDSKYIRIFSFYIPDGKYDEYRSEVISRLKKMVEYAENEGVVLLHENEKGIYGDVASRCLDIFNEIKSPCFAGVFDPANFVQCGQKVYPDAFDMLKPYIKYMHIKDALENHEVVPAGYGIGNVEEIIKSLKTDGWSGFLSLEPHLGSFSGLDNLEMGDDMKGLEKSSAEKFTLAYNALKEILNKLRKD